MSSSGNGGASGARQPLSFGFSAAAAKKIGRAGGASAAVAPPEKRMRLADDDDPLLQADPDAPQRLVLDKGVTMDDVKQLQAGRLNQARAEPELVIPLIERNVWRGGEAVDDAAAVDSQQQQQHDSAISSSSRRRGGAVKQESSLEGASDLEREAVQRLLTGSSSAAGNLGDIKVPLLVQNAVPGLEKLTPGDEAARFRLDVSLRPDEADDEAYDRVPVEKFGLAMLRGMGYKESEGIGVGANKRVVQPYMNRPKLDRGGLGSDPELKLKLEELQTGRKRKHASSSSAAAPTTSSKTAAQQKPKEAEAVSEREKALLSGDFERERRRQLQQELRSRLIPVKARELRVGALVEILEGPEEGSWARVLEILPPAGNDQAATADHEESSDQEWRSQVRLCLRKGDPPERELLLIRAAIRVQDENAMPRDHPAFLVDRERPTKAEAAALATIDAAADAALGQPDRKRQRLSPDSDLGTPGSPAAFAPELTEEDGWLAPGAWLQPGLRVRLITESLGRQWFTRKGVVLPTPSLPPQQPGAELQVRLLMDDPDPAAGTGGAPRVLEGVLARWCETVLPKAGGSGGRAQVLVLRGPGRGLLGVVASKDKRRQRTSVRLTADGRVLEDLGFEDVCEWAGLPAAAAAPKQVSQAPSPPAVATPSHSSRDSSSSDGNSRSAGDDDRRSSRRRSRSSNRDRRKHRDRSRERDRERRSRDRDRSRSRDRKSSSSSRRR